FILIVQSFLRDLICRQLSRRPISLPEDFDRPDTIAADDAEPEHRFMKMFLPMEIEWASVFDHYVSSTHQREDGVVGSLRGLRRELKAGLIPSEWITPELIKAEEGIG